MIRSSIDLGTNTCLLLIADCDATGQPVRIIGDHARVVRLGEGVDRTRALQPAAILRTQECLREYAQILAQAGGRASDTICVATSQARDASNGAEFFRQIEKETGFKFRIITGEQEGRASFLGALLQGMDPVKTAVIDIGGGSTEFITASRSISIDIGSVRYTERFLKSDPVTDEEFWDCQQAIDDALESVKEWRSNHTRSETELLAVAGTATTLAAWFLELKEFDHAKVNTVTLTRGDLHRMVEELKWRTSGERTELAGIEKMRADVLLAGAMILWRATEVLSFPQIRVSSRGLRYGVLLGAL